MLQDKIALRPERLTYQQEVERSSYQASAASSSARHDTGMSVNSNNVESAEQAAAIALAK